VSIPASTNCKPEIEVVADYDGYFKAYVEYLLDKRASCGDAFSVKKIVNSAGPMRPYDVHFEREKDMLTLDFYSCCRFHGGPGADEELLNVL